LLQCLREAQEALPACAWLTSPWTDLTLSGETLFTKEAVDPLIQKSYLAELVDAYVPSGMDPQHPHLSPLFADLVWLSPMLIQVGSSETLLDDATRFATAAGAANVAATLEIWPYMIHAWQIWNAHLEAGRRALSSAGRFLRRHL
jgi:acetyl esterase/lipase